MKLIDSKVPGDQAQRDKIVNEVDKCIFVEASAGAGKTHALVDRMAAMVLSGKPISNICAITYTKAAASEFYERFQKRLGELIRQEKDEGKLELLNKALEDIDLCFMGTIDSFCSTVLSEHPNKPQGVPINARIVENEELAGILNCEYTAILNKEYGQQAYDKAQLFVKVAKQPEKIFVLLISTLLNNLSVELETTDAQYDPEVIQAQCCGSICDLNSIVQFLKANSSYITSKASAERFDRFKSKPEFARVLCSASASSSSGTFIADNINELIDDINSLDKIQINADISALGLRADLKDWFTANSTAEKWENGPAKPFPARGAYTLDMAHAGCSAPLVKLRNVIYAVAVDFCRSVFEQLLQRLKQRGLLTYTTSLYYLRNMLREDAAKGSKLIEHINSRRGYYLIDEFQDTSPIQSEIFFYLASGKDAVEKWYECRPKLGSLFIVGDPKQSIYSFKGSDVTAFRYVRDLFDATKGGFGEVLELSFNFRSSNKLCEWFDSKFPEFMGSEYLPILSGTDKADLKTESTDPKTIDGSYALTIDTLSEEETAAALILELVDNPERLISEDPGKPPRPIRFGDFMIITRTKKKTDVFRKTLSKYSIPTRVEGSASFKSCAALEETAKLIAAAADPYDGIAVYAALTGRLFGITDEKLASVGRSKKAMDAVAKQSDGKKSYGKDRGNIRSLIQYFTAQDREKYFDKDSDDVLRCIETLDAIRYDSCVMPPSAVLQKAADGQRVFAKLGDSEMQYFYYALELMREKEKDGTITSLRDAAGFLRELLSDENSLERCLSFDMAPDAVHIANLHKVKGLEKPIVILSKAYKAKEPKPSVSIIREGKASKCFIFALSEKGKNYDLISTTRFDGKYGSAVDNDFNERKRHNYVAATRAANALFVCRNNGEGKGTDLTDVRDKLKKEWLALAYDSAGNALDEFVFDTSAAFARKKTAAKPSKTGEELYEEAEKNSLIAKKKAEKSVVTFALPRPHEQKLRNTRLDDGKPAGESDELMTAEDKAAKRFTSLHALTKGTLAHRLMEFLVSSNPKAAVQLDDLIAQIIHESELEFSERQLGECREMLGMIADTMLSKGGFRQYGGAPQDLIAELSDDAVTEKYCELPICYMQGREIVYGLIDLLYFKNGKWHIIDYKTDSDAKQAGTVHAAQLEQYKSAVAKLKDIPVSDIDAFVYNIDVN